MQLSKGCVFTALFGVSPTVCSIVWKLIGDNHPHDLQPWHLLRALRFLKVYATEHVNAAIVSADEKRQEVVLAFCETD